MEDDPDSIKPAPRLQYADDVETGPRMGRLALRRTDSRASRGSSRSRRSMSRRRVIDPASMLPIQYRTMSFDVAESQAKAIQREKEAGLEISSGTGSSSKGHGTEFATLDWHMIDHDVVCQRLSTSLEYGLSEVQRVQRLKEHGRNVPSKPPSRWLRKLFTYFFGGFGSILFIASILVFIAWKPLGQPPSQANLALGIVLAIVFFIQAAFTFAQDWSSSRVMASIRTMLPDECVVIRGGRQQSIMGADVVPGDVLCVKMGDKIPADIRFVEVSSDVKFDRSILTAWYINALCKGESLPIHGTVHSTDDNYLETACIGMAGTHCVAGTARGVVVATGDHTVFGKIAKLTSAPKKGLTPLQRELLYFVSLIVGLMLTWIIVVIVVWATWLRKHHPDWISVPNLIVDCVSIAVAFIPEGLPIAVTASLTITAKIMRKNNVLCKTLSTVETLGSVSIICSDKTGTLTKNEMTVTDCMAGPSIVDVKDKIRVGSGQDVDSDTAGAMLARHAALCNAASFDPTTSHLPLAERRIMGDATDQAVLRYAESVAPVEDIRSQWSTVFHLAFNSRNKFMIKIMEPKSPISLESTANPERELAIKGAPDILLARCTTYCKANGGSSQLDRDTRFTIENTKNEWSAHGKRVILLARRSLGSHVFYSQPNSHEYEQEAIALAEHDLEFIGLLGIVDPPRAEIPEVVRTLRGAGIRIFMVTGDFKLTAQAIAAECGIITDRSDVSDVSALEAFDTSADVVHEKHGTEQSNPHRPRAIAISGSEMQGFSKEHWNRLCKYDEIVFARTTPEQKLRIVKELKARGECVGMTGDGVNDAPSLKEADVGIAMGSGSDIAMEAADMILLDSFSAIVEAVQYGRVAYDNLKKTICYLLPAGSFSEFWPVFTNVMFGLPQILSSFLMIIICCFTDCAAATAIAYEKPERDVLLRKPRNTKKDRLVDWRLVLQAYGFIGVVQAVTSFAMSYWYAQRRGLAFGDLWFGFGAVPPSMSQGTYTSILNEASSIYFINLVVMQWFNLMATRTRRASILQQPPLFKRTTRNWYLFPAIAFALIVAVIFLYIPRIQQALGTTSVPAQHYFLPMAFGMGLLLLDEARKFAVRNFPGGVLAKIAW